MKEVDYQTHIVAAVKDGGGAATKLSHRFLTGVSDLLIKMPGLPAGLFEVKKNDMPKLAQRFKLDVTVPQYRFLEAYEVAEMKVGVISLLIDRHEVWIRIVAPRYLKANDNCLNLDRHVRLGGTWPDRYKQIRDILAAYIAGVQTPC